MKLFHLLRSIIAIILLLAVVFFVTNYVDPIKQKVFSTLHISQNIVSDSVKSKSNALSQQFKQDLSGQLDAAKAQLPQLKPSDLTSFLSRSEKIQKDFNDLQMNINEQIVQTKKKNK